MTMLSPRSSLPLLKASLGKTDLTENTLILREKEGRKKRVMPYSMYFLYMQPTKLYVLALCICRFWREHGTTQELVDTHLSLYMSVSCERLKKKLLQFYF